MSNTKRLWTVFCRLRQNHSSISCSVLFSLFVFSLLLTRPWPTPVHLQGELGSAIDIKFERINGTEFVKQYTFSSELFERRFHSLKPLEMKAISGDLSVKLNGIQYDLKNDVILKLPVWTSVRFKLKPLISMLLTSLVGGLLFYFVISNMGRLRDKKSFIVIPLLLIFIYGSSNPGIFWFDTYVNLDTAAVYGLSEFTGLLFCGILMSLYQLFPELGLVHWLNFFIVAFSLISIYLDTKSKKQIFLFGIGLSLILFYPANTNFNISSNRDVAAMWVLGVFLLQLLKHRFDSNRLQSRASFWFLLILSCALRLEFIYVVILLSPLLLLKKKFKLFSGTVLIVGSLLLINHGIISPGDRNAYQSTAFINPLSYILKTKYSDKLPDEIDKRLGNYFKNSHLLDHYSEFEINPFHYGGVNPTATSEDYRQFRSATFEIISENIGLFIENRFKFIQSMFGFSHLKPYIGFLNEPASNPYLQVIMIRLGFDPDKKFSENRFINLYGLDLSFSSPWYMSYFLAVILLFTGVLYKNKSFYAILTILFIRTVIVILTAPAPMYKYNFVIWVVACFSLVYIQQHKQADAALKT